MTITGAIGPLMPRRAAMPRSFTLSLALPGTGSTSETLQGAVVSLVLAVLGASEPSPTPQMVGLLVLSKECAVPRPGRQ